MSQNSQVSDSPINDVGVNQQIIENSPLAQCIGESVNEIGTVMKSVYDSQENLAKQLDYIENTILTFRELPSLISVSDHLEKLIATKQLLLRLKSRIAELQHRTEIIKSSLRENQATFNAKKEVGKPAIGLSIDDEHLLQ